MTSTNAQQKFRFERLDDRIVPCYLFSKSGSYRIHDCYRQIPKVEPVIDLEIVDLERVNFGPGWTSNQVEDAVDPARLETFVCDIIPCINSMPTYAAYIHGFLVR